MHDILFYYILYRKKYNRKSIKFKNYINHYTIVTAKFCITKTLVGAVLQDFGVQIKELSVLHDTSNTATSTGFGIRYITPIGPLRFDIGFKWKKSYEKEPGYAWFLSLGSA